MSRLKTFLKYALWLIGFYIFSNILIFIGLNSNYKDIYIYKNIPSQVKVETAKTAVTKGRIRGTLTNGTGIDDVSGKYLKFDFYTKLDTLAGTEYIEIGNLKENEQKEFNCKFVCSNVAYYDISIVDEAEEVQNNGIFGYTWREIKAIWLFAVLLFS